MEALDAQQQRPGQGRTEATRPGTGASGPRNGATRPGTGASAPSDPPRDVPAMVETAKTRDSSGTSSVAPLPTAETTVLAPPPPARPPPVRSIPAPPPP